MLCPPDPPDPVPALRSTEPVKTEPAKTDTHATTDDGVKLHYEEAGAGKDVVGMLRKDLELEYEVRAALQKGIELAESASDFVTRDIILAQLRDTEEDHTYWLEKQLGLIEKVGLENYQQSQM